MCSQCGEATVAFYARSRQSPSKRLVSDVEFRQLQMQGKWPFTDRSALSAVDADAYFNSAFRTDGISQADLRAALLASPCSERVRSLTLAWEQRQQRAAMPDPMPPLSTQLPPAITKLADLLNVEPRGLATVLQSAYCPRLAVPHNAAWRALSNVEDLPVNTIEDRAAAVVVCAHHRSAHPSVSWRARILGVGSTHRMLCACATGSAASGWEG